MGFVGDVVEGAVGFAKDVAGFAGDVVALGQKAMTFVSAIQSGNFGEVASTLGDIFFDEELTDEERESLDDVIRGRSGEEATIMDVRPAGGNVFA